MLTYTDVVRRSVVCAGILLAVDVAVALLPFFTWIDSSTIAIIGDLLLVEVALLFIGAGILDFISSAGMTGFRKLFSSSVEYSSTRRKEIERHAMVFLATALILLATMILLAVHDLSGAALSRRGPKWVRLTSLSSLNLMRKIGERLRVSYRRFLLLLAAARCEDSDHNDHDDDG